MKQILTALSSKSRQLMQQGLNAGHMPHFASSATNANLSAEDLKSVKGFETAHRHSRRVRFLRRAIPLSVIGMIGGGILYWFFSLFGSSTPVIAVNTRGVSGSKILMDQPKLSGYKKDSKAYEVIAKTALQDVKKPTIVEMNDPKAKVEMADNGWAHLSSGTGIYDTATEKMEAISRVNVELDTGVTLKMSNARIDFKGGNLTTKQPVEVNFANGNIKADALDVEESGKKITFTGNVRSFFTDPEQVSGKNRKQTTGG